MKEFFKNFMPYIRGHYPLFCLAVFAGIFAALCTAGVTYLVKPMLDEVFVDKDTTKLALIPFLLMFAYIGKALGSYAQGYLMSHIGEDIVRQIRDKMLYHMLSLDLNFFNKNRNGELIARITNDIGLIRSAVSSIFAEFVREGVTAIALIAVVIYQSPKLALLGLVILPLSIIPIAAIVRRLKKVSKKAQEKNADITSNLNEVFNNIEMIKVNSAEELESQKFKSQNQEFFKINMKNTLIGTLDNPVMEILGALAIGGVLYVGGKSVIDGSLTVGEFFSFNTALFMAYTPIKRLLNCVVRMQSAIVANQRILEIFTQKSAIRDGSKELESEIDEIAFCNVSFKYDEDEVLHQISCSFKKNTITALVGKSGSGKSTMIALLLRLYDINSGKITINNTPIQDFSIKSLRSKISVVNQRIFILNDSIAKNVAYGHKMDEERVKWALKQAMALEFVESLPQGIETKLDEFGANLSGGQRQRIAIARALYKDAQILILDEATSALDEKTEEAIKHTIDLIRKDKIIILIAHRPSTIELADQILRIEDGFLK
ncbi:ABC transporter ATP-binding protein [Helicobacter cholecystus]|uniref:Multidrug resistance-like ATP-binding protein MdlB n=1 Tax=Helicobacter cholecystus TaxID=45498 RepID=A0A3D8ITT9_9HELI|nr:ABC transporter ATP-binding protein [Helicobacter cholecystus]RDU68698.1 ABC transporter ATP-binding protein [Helicobacter cholecystus]VEJ26151.1 multidrug resistance protein MsbA [Helicobacter cholecystus]